MGPRPGYVGDHFIRAMAVPFHAVTSSCCMNLGGCREARQAPKSITPTPPGSRPMASELSHFSPPRPSVASTDHLRQTGTPSEPGSETGKPLPRCAAARICPPRTYAGRPLIHHPQMAQQEWRPRALPLGGTAAPGGLSHRCLPSEPVTPAPSSASGRCGVCCPPPPALRHISKCDAASLGATLGKAATGAAHPPPPRSSALTISSTTRLQPHGSPPVAAARPRRRHSPATTAVAAVTAVPNTIEAALHKCL
jgi:hypothetical protein